MLYRLIAVTTVGMFALGALYAPDDVEPRAAAFASADAAPGRAGPADSAIEVGRSAFAALGLPLAAPKAVRRDGPTEAEAVAIALRRGEEIKAAREGGTGVVVANPESAKVAAPAPTADLAAEAPAAAPAPLWTVTGSTVNLRAGPGTSHAVVGQVRLGDRARPLGDTGGDWIHIELADGGSDAWIFSRFIAPSEG